MIESIDPRHRWGSTLVCTTIETACALAWDHMDLRVRHGTRPKEENVTSIIYDTMLRLEPHRVHGYEFNRGEEAVSGADWEWWIKGRSSWLGLSIQAKVSDKPKNPVVKIYHKAKSRPFDQVSNLIAWAKIRRSNPIYFIYGYFDPVKFASAKTNCGSRITLPNRTEAAVLAIHAADVRRRYNKRKIQLRYDMEHMLPARCVFCCAIGGGTIAERVERLLTRRDTLMSTTEEEIIRTERPPDYVRFVEESTPGERHRHPVHAEEFDIRPPKRVTVIEDDLA